MNILALTTRGLESISAAEMSTLPGMVSPQVAYRRVTAEYQGALKHLLRLTTVDDVFIHLATWEGIGRPRDALRHLNQHSQGLDVAVAVGALRNLRPLDAAPAFSITASFVGKRNYTTAEIKQAVAEGVLAAQPGWRYVDDDRDAALNLRLFIEHETALVGLRIGATSLHRRPYKQHHLPGALKPSVAAAMLHVAGLEPGQRLLDPFCGTGTIVIEAAYQGAAAAGSDLAANALQMALADLNRAALYATFVQGDARQLPFRRACMDCVVSNMPWGKQVLNPQDLPTLYRASYAEMRRVIAPGGVIVLLTSTPELLPDQPQIQIEISLFGETPKISLFRPG